MILAAAAGCGSGPQTASARPDAARETVLRVAPSSDLEILDPMFTTSGTTRNHAYLIYDTLFGMDAQGRIAPQMVNSWSVSKDGKLWTFTLRDGLEFHDGAPVTSGDVIASLQRWGQKDVMGQRLLAFVESWEASSPQTFRMKLKAPYALVPESLGKPDSYVAFVMPRRVAEIPADTPIDDMTGSGPFIFRKDEWKQGEKVVYVRNPRYKPRPEPPSGTAGGKTAKVDRVEWIIIKDPQTQVNALAAGEVDLLTSAPHDLYPSLRGNPNIHMFDDAPFTGQFQMIFNHLQPPFDKPKARRAAMAALNQPAFLQTQVGIADKYHVCFSVYPCGAPYATTKGMELLENHSLDRARQLLKESGYRGETVIVLRPSDLASLAKLPVVAAQLLRQAGFNVEVQSMDWNTMLARRARKEGWNVFLTLWWWPALLNPVTSNVLSAEGYPHAYYGWPSDPALEALRSDFALARTEEERKRIAERVQVRAMDLAVFVPLGEFQLVMAARRSVTGAVPGFFPVFWNLEKE
jgi:peptide/nickel transport system substrate-binding protein